MGAETVRHSDEGADVRRQLGDCCVRLAVAQDWPIAPGRRDHQDRSRVGVSCKPLVGANGGVPLEELAPRAGPAGALQEPRNPEGQRQPPAYGALPAQREPTIVGASLGVETDFDFEPVGGQRLGDPLRPFDDRDRIGDSLVPAQIVELARAAEPVEIGVDDRSPRRVIDLHQGEGRAGRLEIAHPGQGPDQASGEGRLARAEIAGQADEVAGLEPCGLGCGDFQHRRLVRRLQAPSVGSLGPVGAIGHALLLRRLPPGGRRQLGVAAAAAVASTGKMQVTVVPSLGAVSISTRP